jgi:small subunit ribosomal protein S18
MIRPAAAAAVAAGRRKDTREYMPAITSRRRDKRAKGGGPGQGRRRSCHFCKEKIEEVDYKNSVALKRFVSEKGKIRSQRITGACRCHQRQVSVAVKRAREMALMPYVVR